MKELVLSVFLFTQGVSAGTVTGRLLGVDGTPAAGVRVTALAAPDVNDPRGGAAIIVSIAQTDALGRYRLENIQPGRYFITAGLVDFPTYYPGVAGMASATAVTVTSGSEIAGMDFAIARVTTLKVSGRVIREGNPTAPMTQSVFLSGSNLPGESTTGILPDGRFQFSNVRPGKYSIGLSPANGSVPQDIVVDDKDVVTELTAPLTVAVTGSVVVEGGGLRPRFSIVFQGTGPNPLRVTSSLLSNGTFGAVQLPPGDYQLTPSALPAGYSYALITAGTTDLLKNPLRVSATDAPKFVVTLGVSSPPPWVKVSGHITDSNNNPATGPTRIALIGGNVAAILEAAVGANGSFEFPMILPGTYSVTWSPMGDPAVSRVTVGKADINDLRVAIPSTRNVSGRVVVEGGGPSPRLVFGVTNTAGESRTPVTVSPQPDGTFAITLPAGEQMISLSTPPAGYQLKSMTYGSTDLLVNPLRIEAANTQEIRVTLSSTLTSGLFRVSGRVSGLDWTTTSPTEIGLTGGPLPVPHTPISSDGSFELLAVPPGRYTAEVSAYTSRGNIRMSKALVVTDKDLTGIEISIPPQKAVVGHVTVDNENPLPRFWLMLTREPADLYPSMQPDGVFAVNLPEGDYSIALTGLPDGYSVKSLTYGSTDLLRNPVKISAMDTAKLQVAFATERPNVGGRVSGRVIGLTAQTGPAVTMSVYGMTASQRVSIGGDGLFEVPKVLPGKHYFQISTAGILSMDIPAAGLTGITVAAVTGRLELENTNRPTTGTIRVERNTGTAATVGSSDGTFRLLLAEGENRIVVSALPANGYVKSILYGTVDALNQPLKIDPNTAPAELRITIGLRAPL